MKRLPVCCGPQSVGFLGDSGSIDEDVTGPASAPLLVLLPRLPHHAGPQAGLQDPLELVSHLSPSLDFRHHPHPHAHHPDGGALQAGL